MQLEMILAPEQFGRYADSATAPVIPPEYRLRTYRPGDEDQYLSLMRRVGFSWGEESLRNALRTMLPDGLFFVEYEPTAEIVATTVAGHGSNDFHPTCGELGWVGVDPAHRGKGLGRIVCDAVVRRFVDAGYRDIVLRTDEFRLPAIKTYLNLGFRPLIRNEEMVGRWKLVLENLGMEAARFDELAVESVRPDCALEGYRRWVRHDVAGPAELKETSGVLRVGLLPLFLDLYDLHRPDLRSGVTRFLGRAVATLRSAAPEDHLEIIEAPIITTRSNVDDAAKLFEESRVDLIVTLHLSYSPSLLVADYLRRSGKPVLILDSTPAQEFLLDDTSYLLENHGVHGVMDLTSVLKSMGVPYRVAAGHIDDPAYREKLADEILGAMLAKKFRNQRIGVTGTPFLGMGDFAIRRPELGASFGIQVIDVDSTTVVSRARSIDQESVARCIDEDKARFDLSTVDAAVLEREVRHFLALDELCKELDLSGYTMNFEHTGPELPPPFYAVSKLMQRGIGYAGESDVITACLGRPFAALPVRSMFSEIFCVDWKSGELMFSHMGEINPAFAAKKGGSLVSKLAIGHDRPSVYFRFPIDPVAVTMVNLGLVDGVPVRVVAAVLDLVERSPAPGVDAPHFFAKPRMPVQEFLEKYALEGGGHHVYLVEGDVTSTMQVMCSYLGLSYAEVR